MTYFDPNFPEDIYTIVEFLNSNGDIVEQKDATMVRNHLGGYSLIKDIIIIN
jgi:hypothetical protein